MLIFSPQWEGLTSVLIAMLCLSLFGAALYLISRLWGDRDTDPKARRNIILLAIGAVLSVSLLWSVLRTPEAQDVTRTGYVNGGDVWKSYKRNGVYQTKRDLFYGRAFSPEYQEGELFPPWGEPGAPRATNYTNRDFKTGETFEVVPESIKTFNDHPREWRHIKGVIPKGTKLRTRRVLFSKTSNPDGIDKIYYIAVFIDGPFAGKSVLLNRISTGDNDSAQSVDSSYLEQVDEEFRAP